MARQDGEEIQAQQNPISICSSRYTGSGSARDWLVIDPDGELVCITVYKRGAEEVVRRLAA